MKFPWLAIFVFFIPLLNDWNISFEKNLFFLLLCYFHTLEGVFGTWSGCRLVVLWSPISSSKFICCARNSPKSSVQVRRVLSFYCFCSFFFWFFFGYQFFSYENSFFSVFFISCFVFFLSCARFFTFLIWFRKVIAFPRSFYRSLSRYLSLFLLFFCLL